MRNESSTQGGSRRFAAVGALLLALAWLTFATFVSSASAQIPPQKENRFLFIINTSSAMRHSTNGVFEAVQGLLQTEMQGQMRDGDTFGIWSYDEQLHTDFPMQVWSGKTKDEILGRATAYLNSRHYQKRAHLDKVMPALRAVVGASQVITLVFIFDGSETMQGTGFDQDINDLQKEFGRQMRADNVPFVTVLAAHDAKFFEYSVNVPGTVTLPHTADLIIRPPVTNAAPPLVAVVPPPPPAPAPKAPEPRHFELILTNPAPAKVIQPEPAPAPVVQTPPTPVKPVVQPSPAPAPVPTPLVPASAPPETVLVTSIASVPPSVAAPVNPDLTPAPESRGPSRVTLAETTKPEPARPTIQITAPPPPAPAVSSQPPSSVPANPPTTARIAAPMAAQTVVAIPSPEDHIALLIIAFSLLTIAVVLVLFLFRRSRSSPSLISQSLDRPR